MQFIQLSNISYTYTNQSEPVFSVISFDISSEERIALIGKNGEGKSTLIKIIIGELTEYEGRVTFPKNEPVIGYLPQDMTLLSDLSVRNEFLSANEEYYKVIQELASLNDRQELSVEQGMYSAKLWEEYYRLKINEYVKSIDTLLSELNLDSYRDVSCLKISEGEKTRLQLGKLLLHKPDILILDEPTNHLDIDNLQWLERWMLKFSGAIFYVSHDREFINKTATKIIEISQGSATIRHGNYTSFQNNLEAEKAHQLTQYEERVKLVQKLHTAAQKRRSWARTFQADTGSEGGGFKYESIFNAVRTMHQQAKNIEERIKMLQNRYPVEKPWMEKHRKITFSQNTNCSKIVISCNGLNKSYGNNLVLQNLCFHAEKGEKIWLSGANGSGKSTFIRILAGIEKNYDGEVYIGERVISGWFEQSLSILPIDLTPLEYAGKKNQEEHEIRNFFGCLGMSGEIVNRPIKTLSWGERSKTQLVKLLTSEYNLLLLDEPTNHLDMATRMMLEEALQRYPGTVVFVSHDRAFIENITTREYRLSRPGFIPHERDA